MLQNTISVQKYQKTRLVNIYAEKIKKTLDFPESKMYNMHIIMNGM